MITVSQVMLSSAKQLSEKGREEVLRTQQRASLSIMLLIIFSAMAVMINSFFLRRGIVQPLADLQKGSQIIGHGNLSYRISLDRQDEIGELGKAFDQMLKNLQEITVSRDLLEKEIAERKQIEAELRLDKEILDYMNEGVCLITTSDGILRYTNPIFNQMFGYEEGELIGENFRLLNLRADVSPEKTVKIIAKELNENSEWRGEVETVQKNGTCFWSQINVSTFKHHDLKNI